MNKAILALAALLLFACVFTSSNWQDDPKTGDGEILRLDRIRLFGQAGIYHLFAAALFVALFLVKFAPGGDGDPRRLAGRPSWLKTIMWLFFVPLNVLIYLTVRIQDIRLQDLGLAPVVEFGTLLVVTYFFLDLVFEPMDRRGLMGSLTILQVLVLGRAAYTVGKYLLGYGVELSLSGGLRLGQENDFADFFVLLFVAGLVRLLFEAEGPRLRLLNLASVVVPAAIAVVSQRRYFQAEVLIAAAAVGLVHLRRNRGRAATRAAAAGLAGTVAFGLLLAVGPETLAGNPYVGRFATSLSLVSDRYESRFGTQAGHREEIRDGWRNVKANWLLGVTPFGLDRVVKAESTWQKGAFVHNAYLFAWEIYGLFGVVLFAAFYLLALRGGMRTLARGEPLGLVLAVFIGCQMVKNIVWVTAFYYINITIVYLFLAALVLKAGSLAEERRGGGGAPARPRQGEHP